MWIVGVKIWWVVSLRLLLDEMYAGLKEYFETLGWEVLTVQEVGCREEKTRRLLVMQ